MNDYPEIL